MKIAVVGIGHVGLVTSLAFASLGHDVTCLEKNEAIRDALKKGNSHIHESGIEILLKKVLAGNLLHIVPSKCDHLTDSDIVFVCVNTPIGNEGIDFGQLESALLTVGKAISQSQKYMTVVIKSTVLPGTTDGFVKTTLERVSSKKCGEEFGLAVNPEFLQEGSGLDDFLNSDRIVIGTDHVPTRKKLLSLYSNWDCDKITVNSKTAEFIKYYNNNLLSLMISFSNEMSGIAKLEKDIDFKDVLHGVTRDKRLNPIYNNTRIKPGILSYLTPGPGFGGSCLPKDLEAFTYYAQSNGVPSPILNAVTQINNDQPSAVIALMKKAIGDLSGKTILLLGLAHKPNTNDTRQSASVKIAGLLLRENAALILHDPVVTKKEIHIRLAGHEVVSFASDWKHELDRSSIVVLLTPWNEYKELEKKELAEKLAGKYLVDTRHFYDQKAFKASNYISV